MMDKLNKWNGIVGENLTPLNLMVNFWIVIFRFGIYIVVDDKWIIFDQFNIWTLSVEQENSAKREIYQLGHLYCLLQNKHKKKNRNLNRRPGFLLCALRLVKLAQVLKIAKLYSEIFHIFSKKFYLNWITFLFHFPSFEKDKEKKAKTKIKKFQPNYHRR